MNVLQQRRESFVDAASASRLSSRVMNNDDETKDGAERDPSALQPPELVATAGAAGEVLNLPPVFPELHHDGPELLQERPGRTGQRAQASQQVAEVSTRRLRIRRAVVA